MLAHNGTSFLSRAPQGLPLCDGRFFVGTRSVAIKYELMLQKTNRRESKTKNLLRTERHRSTEIVESNETILNSLRNSSTVPQHIFVSA